MNEATVVNPGRRRWRSMVWSIVAIVMLAMLLPSLGYVMAQSGGGDVPRGFGPERDTNPRSQMWRDAREGQAGFTTQTGPYVTNTMINNSGENWRQFRTGPLVTYGGWFLAFALAVIVIFAVIVGRKQLDGGRAGMTILRWRGYERLLHWFVAAAFIVLAITGLSLLFGRTVLIPLFGPQGFAAYAQIAMEVHNYLGPVFSVALLLMIVLWAKDNIPTRTDVEWFKQGGGIFGKRHPSAGKLNGGEKVWFWFGVFALGLIVSVSGVILDFPIFGQTRETMAISQGLHSIAAILWIGFFLGHAYIGTLGQDGALEGMTTGRVDVNWARQHHDLWYQEELANGAQPLPDDREVPVRDQPPGVSQPSH